MAHLRHLLFAAIAIAAAAPAGFAGIIDLGPAGNVITANTPIPFTLPIEALNGGNFGFVFENEGLPMGHIQLIEPTTITLYVDTLNPQSGTVIGVYLTDMAHQPLPNTFRDSELGFGFTDGQVFLPLIDPVATSAPILPSDVEPGGYFHDIHFEIGPLNGLNPTTNNAAIVFNQDVITDTWVPEPGSFVALLGLGCVTALGCRRRGGRCRRG